MNIIFCSTFHFNAEDSWPQSAIHYSVDRKFQFHWLEIIFKGIALFSALPFPLINLLNHNQNWLPSCLASYSTIRFPRCCWYKCRPSSRWQVYSGDSTWEWSQLSVVNVTHGLLFCAASKSRESPETLRDRWQPRQEVLAGQTAQLHGGARNSDHSMSDHF